jgi:hypothetical protein
MKRLFLVVTLMLVHLYADMPDRIWTMADASIIETTERIVGGTDAGSLQESEPDNISDVTYSDGEEYIVGSEITPSKNLDDIPLAKTYPATSIEEKVISAPDRENAFTKKVDEVVSQIKKSTVSNNKSQQPVKKEEKKVVLTTKEISNQHAVSTPSKSEKQIETIPQQHSQMRADFEFQTWITLFKEHKMLSAILAGLLLLLFLLSIKLLLEKRSSTPVVKEEVYASNREVFSKMLESYSHLKGDVHKIFLKRKQNILFNDDFTQYQKAKALLELEHEYTQITYYDLPKLFSDDFDRFTEGHRALSSKPELREIIAEFVHARVAGNNYTKAQRERIEKNMKSFYNSYQHTWQYNEKIEQKSDEEQKAYLLQ